MNIWLVSREYAGIAEAGGVKNVTCSLCEVLARTGESVSCFLPLYGCTEFDQITDYTQLQVPDTNVSVCGSDERVTFSCGYIGNGRIRIIFVCHPAFAEKKAVYTYTTDDQLKNPAFVRGTGHRDSLFLNVLFQKAVIAYGTHSEEQPPDIIHCQDATAALVPFFLEYGRYAFFAHTGCVVTIHNAGPFYHHEFSSAAEASFYMDLPEDIVARGTGTDGKKIEPFLLASTNAVLTTVSPSYASELLQSDNVNTDGLSAEFAARRIHITGITNGIDFERYNPSDMKKSLLPYAYDPCSGDFQGKFLCRDWFMRYIATGKTVDSTTAETYLDGVQRFGRLEVENRQPVYISYHGRIAYQKGIDILAEAVVLLADRFPEIRFVIAGQGDQKLEGILEKLAGRYEGRFVFFAGYNRKLSRLCTAVSDFAILPSIFEPCGLEDFIAQIFGTIPVANATGGLKKIVSGSTGFLYAPNTGVQLAAELSELIPEFQKNPDRFAKMCVHASQQVKSQYSWHTIVMENYLPLYRKISKSCSIPFCHFF